MVSAQITWEKNNQDSVSLIQLLYGFQSFINVFKKISEVFLLYFFNWLNKYLSIDFN